LISLIGSGDKKYTYLISLYGFSRIDPLGVISFETDPKAEEQSSLRLPSLLSIPRKDIEHISKNLTLGPEEQPYRHNDDEYHHWENEDDGRGPPRTQTGMVKVCKTILCTIG
jgi:hypothetical protein